MIKLKKINKKVISLVLFVILLAAVWIVPFKCSTVFVRFYTPNVADGTFAEFEVFADTLFGQSYKDDTLVEKGRITLKLENAFLDFTKISVSEPLIAQDVSQMQIRGHSFKNSDFVCAKMTGEVFYLDENGDYVLTEQAVKTVKKGINNPFGIRLMLTVFLIFAAVSAVLFWLLKKYFGKFKAATVVTCFLSGAFLILQTSIDGALIKDIPLFNGEIKNSVLVISLVSAVFVLISLCVLFFDTKKKGIYKSIVLTVYIFVLLLSVFKTFFYNDCVGKTPDETAHIGYVAYLTQNSEIIPHHENIRTIYKLYGNDYEQTFTFIDNTISYLKHPSFYYHIMRLANGVHFNADNTFTVDVFKLRTFSMCFVFAALCIMFYIGYTRIKASPAIHLLYAAAVTSVPMFLYTASGVNNDSLTLLTTTLFFLGILRYTEKKRNLLTYLLIAFGVSLTVLTKITAGIIVAVAALAVLGVTLYKEKNFKELVSYKFLLTLPVYFVAASYFLAFYARYKSFQPNIFVMDAEYAMKTTFFADYSVRSTKSLLMYVRYYIQHFMKTWTSIASHIALFKSDNNWLSVQNIALVSLWFAPLILLNKKIRSAVNSKRVFLAGYLGMAAAFVLQLYNGYSIFLSRGYAGGYQSRYYLCAIVFIGFAFACIFAAAEKLVQQKNTLIFKTAQKAVLIFAIAFTGVLLYEDFIYFLLYYVSYV